MYFCIKNALFLSVSTFFCIFAPEKQIETMQRIYALITGASSGIGFEYAVVMAERGYHLIILSNEEAIQVRAEELRQAHPGLDIVPLVMDLGRQEAAKELYDWCHERDYLVEVLINNAGVFHHKDYLDDSEAFNRLILNLHVLTPAMLVYYFGQDMVARHKGYILNMSSVSSNFGLQTIAAYSGTKAFLHIFSRSLHIELKHKGVYLTCVRPGAVATNLYGLRSSLLKLGVNIGVIMTPQRLARKGVKAMFRGKCSIAPGLFTQFLKIVPYIPVCIPRLVRRLGWY